MNELMVVMFDLTNNVMTVVMGELTNGVMVLNMIGLTNGEMGDLIGWIVVKMTDIDDVTLNI